MGWEVLIFIGLLILPSSIDAYEQKHYFPLILNGGLLLAVLLLMKSIQYHIRGHDLVVKNSIFETTTIDIRRIRKIKKTNNLIASPAPSVFGRISLYWDENHLIISPDNLKTFETELRKINPSITIEK